MVVGDDITVLGNNDSGTHTHLILGSVGESEEIIEHRRSLLACLLDNFHIYD